MVYALAENLAAAEQVQGSIFYSPANFLYEIRLISYCLRRLGDWETGRLGDLSSTDINTFRILD